MTSNYALADALVKAHGTITLKSICSIFDIKEYENRMNEEMVLLILIVLSLFTNENNHMVLALEFE